MNTTQNIQDQSRPAQTCTQPLTRFYIYENLNLICDRAFDKEQITIGSSRDADLFLDHQSVADIHAMVQCREDQVFLTNNYPQNGLRLNGRAVGLAELQHEDVIDIGPYSLKVKITAAPPQVMATEDSATYAVRLVNRYGTSQAIQTAAIQLARLLKTSPDKVVPILSKDHYFLKKGLNGLEAARVQNALLRAGVVCDVQLETPEPAAPVAPTMPESLKTSPTVSAPEPELSLAQEPELSPAQEPEFSLDQEPELSLAQEPELSPAQEPEFSLDQEPELSLAQEPELSLAQEPELSLAQEPELSLAQEPEFSLDQEPELSLAQEPGLSLAQEPELSLAQEPELSLTHEPEMSPAPKPEFSLAPEFDEIQELDDAQEAQGARDVQEAVAPTRFETHVSFSDIYQDEEDDDEEDDVWEATFSLQEQLDRPTQSARQLHKMPEQMQVVKSIGESVVDVRFLQGRQKYFINTDKGRFCLANSKAGGHIALKSDFSGYIRSTSGEITADLDSYKTSEFQLRRKKPIYRIPLPDKDVVIVEAGGCKYRIAQVQQHPTPHVVASKQVSDFSWKHWASSAGTHFVLMLCMSVYLYFQASAPHKPEPHFVKIDPSMLQQLQQPKVPPKPKPPPPPPKPEPKKEVQKVKPQKQKPVKKKKPPAKVAKGKKTRKKGARNAPVSKHPKAGGGFGKGNIKNRNINQTGLLSVLGSAKIGGPSEAIASVTNLDAVAVPGATSKNFTVGGLKGALGNGKIAVASGQIMQTKGSTQVLRSAGARGKGEVAALERGTTGKKKVKSMVTAKMSRTVKIEGGMSREMVKRVIDQHLEEITYCYETALMTNPSILGRIVFEWKIMMNGRVGEIRIVASSVNSHEIHSCIKSAIKTWQFPKPVGAEVVVSYPFVFDLVTF